MCGDNSDEIRSVRRRKLLVIESEFDSDSVTTKDSQSQSLEWINCTESEEILSRILFITDNTNAGPQISPDKKELFHFFFF
jgi:hypothetical protein